MGKTLIIKGADFSENAVLTTRWYNSVTNLQGNYTFTNRQIIVDPEAQELMGLMGKPVNTVRLYTVAAADNIEIGIIGITGSRDEGTITLGEKRALHSYDVIAGENEITLVEPIVLGDGECIYFNNANQVFTYNAVAGDSTALLSANGWCFGLYNKWNPKVGKFPIEFGYVAE